MNWWALILAGGIPAQNDFDPGSLVYLGIVLLLTVLGTIFQKRKSGEQAGRGKPGSQEPARPPALPPTPRRAEPWPTVGRTAADRAAPRARPVPQADIQALQAIPATLRPLPIPRPASVPAPPAIARTVEPRPERRDELPRGKPAGEAVITAISDRPKAGSPKTPAVRSEQIGPDWRERMMRDRQGLQAALVMSEILGPPLSMRQHDWP